MTLSWAERTCKSVLLGARVPSEIVVRPSADVETTRRQKPGLPVRFRQSPRCCFFDENRLPVSKDMDFFGERIGDAAETIAIRTPLNTASDRIDK